MNVTNMQYLAKNTMEGIITEGEGDFLVSSG